MHGKCFFNHSQKEAREQTSQDVDEESSKGEPVRAQGALAEVNRISGERTEETTKAYDQKFHKRSYPKRVSSRSHQPIGGYKADSIA
jgi:hypothetical protein